MADVTSTARTTYLRWASGLLAAAMLVLSICSLEGYRAGIDRIPVMAGETPATLYRQPGAEGPLVVILHGFAGSRQLMEAFSLTLAQAGYSALAYDLEGHGRNPVPMGGDVTSIDGTTARLIAETRRVIDAGLTATGWQGPVALIGHSMASDVVVRTGLADPRVGPVVGVSMFSGGVTAVEPTRLLAISGAWETGLRAEALRVLRLVDPSAEEGETATSPTTRRRAIAAPMVEHVGVLYSATTLTETRDWLDAFYQRPAETAPVAAIGGWIALLLASIVALGWSLAGLLPDRAETAPVPRTTFLACLILPAICVPVLATRIGISFLPVLVADYLALHMLLYGGTQLAILWVAGVRPGRLATLPMAALLAYGIGAFGLALDRYAASFVPLGPRLIVLAGVAVGAVTFMLADTMLKEAGRAPFWRRASLLVAFIGSLIFAVWLDIDRLLFLVIILPVILLFFLVFGLLGRWVGQRSGALPVGIALGIILAWSLAASFPVFEP